MIHSVPCDPETADHRIRIVFLARSLEVGGAEVQLASLARGLDRGAFDVSVACLYARGSLLDELSVAQVPIVPLGKRGRWDLAGFMPRFVRSLRQLRPDIVHAFLGPPNILAAVARPWLPESHVVWGVRASNMDLDHYDWSWRVTSFLERRLAGHVDKIVANSYAGRDVAVAGGLPRERLTIIPNGIDTTRFIPDQTYRAALRTEWRVPADAFLVGKVARLDPMKDHRSFLQAVALSGSGNPRMRFVCVGDGPRAYAEILRREAESLGLHDHLVWAGARSDMAAVYNAFDVVTLTSAFGEGFPNVLGEAMACGKPCVVTDVGDSARIVGDTGISVVPGDAAEIARSWRKLADEAPDEQDVRRARCRTRIVDSFSMIAMVDAYARLYHEITGIDTHMVD